MKKILVIITISAVLLSFSSCLGYENDREFDVEETTPIESIIETTEKNKPKGTDKKETSEDEIIIITKKEVPTEQTVSETMKINELTIGDAINVEYLEITFGIEVEVVKENPYSSKNNVKLPIKIKNLKDDSYEFTPWKFTYFGSRGGEVEDKGYLFEDKIVKSKLRSGAEVLYSLYFAYDGDGDYYVEFVILNNKVELRVPVYTENNTD
ncbi:MAG: hypothetical protein FWF94_03050 [Oscillospiraceae bacterium]|nr:hypothetical protein [Oscillospiraceae bacterium]